MAELTAKELSSRGGKNRWANIKNKMTKEERSEMMRKVRYGKIDKKPKPIV